MKYLSNTDDFTIRTNIISYLNNAYDIESDVNRMLVLFSSKDQITYLVKLDFDFFIINDDKGKVYISLNRPIEILNKIEVYEDKKYFKIYFIGVNRSLFVSKELFENIDHVKHKIRNL